MRNPFRSQLSKDMEQDLAGFDSIKAFCYEAFRRGLRPGELMGHCGWLKQRTVMTYFEGWKAVAGTANETPASKQMLADIKKRMHDPVFRAYLVTELSRKHQLSPEEVEEVIRRPHGITGIPSGRTRKKLLAYRDLKTLDQAFNLVNRCKSLGLPPNEVIDKAVEYISDVEDLRRDVEEKMQNDRTEAEQRDLEMFLLKGKTKLLIKDHQNKADIWKYLTNETPTEPDQSHETQVQ